MQFFQDLGALVEQRWKNQNYADQVFPGIAAEALAEMPPHDHVDPWDIIRWIHNASEIPEQRDIDSRFGNPAITLYDGPRFYIDVYFWLDGTTTIHQHGFCGAFQVLLGSSLHSRYRFDLKQQIDQYFAQGDITLETVDLLERGSISQILPGKTYIHSLFHLDRPSATICVRTYQTVAGMPQYNYHRPCFAIDPFFKSALSIKQVQSASLLLSIRHPETDALISELLSRSDFQTAFAILEVAQKHLLHSHLEHAFGISTGAQRFTALVEAARRRHGELVDFIEPLFDETHRQHNLVLRRGQITSNEHRFFLALLLNVPDRVKILDLVKRRYPEQNPVDTIVDWVEELAHTKLMGSSEANVLGIEHFDDKYLFVFQCLLEGRSLEQTKSAFEEEVSIEHARGLGGKIEELYDNIRNSILFKSIFLDSTTIVAAAHSLTS